MNFVNLCISIYNSLTSVLILEICFFAGLSSDRVSNFKCVHVSLLTLKLGLRSNY